MRCFFIFLLGFFCSVSVYASDEPFTFPSNRGGTGLMEIPTARVIQEDSFRIGASQIKPYRFFYAVISPYKKLELNLHITEIIDVPAPALGDDFGNYKDKVFEMKYQLFPEGKYSPALAIGLMDPHGTRIHPSQYIVASKQIYPFDFTVGFGNGIFGKKPLPEQGEGIKVEMFSDPGGWLSDSQFFWGVQFAPSEKYALMVEYSPIKYHIQTRDPAQKKYFKKPVPSKFNFGLRYKPTEWSEVDLSFQRGNEIGVNLSMAFNIGKPFIHIYTPPYKKNPANRTDPLSDRLIEALHHSGFSDISIIFEGSELWVEAQNEKYFYNTKAIGVVLDILDKLSAENTRNIHIILKENGIPIIRLSTTRTNINELYSEELKLNEFIYLSEINTNISRIRTPRGIYRKSIRYGLKPSIETFLNDPAGFFKYRLGLSGWTSYNPWKGATIRTSLSWYPVNNIESANEPFSIPVRSDIVLYKKEAVVLSTLLMNQTHKFENELYGRVAIGYLEVQYAGIDAEIAKPIFNGRILLGLSGSIVKKREPENMLKLKGNDVKNVYTTAFINTRFNFPKQEIALDIKAGRFLAGDNGVSFAISKFINGVKLSAWYTITDTSDFTDKFNDGYNDKGISVSIPLRLFTGTETRKTGAFSITPWTRDTGQDIIHFDPLFDLIGRNTKIFLEKDEKHIY